VKTVRPAAVVAVDTVVIATIVEIAVTVARADKRILVANNRAQAGEAIRRPVPFRLKQPVPQTIFSFSTGLTA
jgi:hypothetical protein